jgi:hypothetical protein
MRNHRFLAAAPLPPSLPDENAMHRFATRNAWTLATLAMVVLSLSVLIACFSQRISLALWPTDPVPANSFADPMLVGRYYDGDGLGVNLNLSLRGDGTYSCSWTGCLGDYGSTQGNWGRLGDTIHISPTKLDGMFKRKPLGNLQVSDRVGGRQLFGYNGFSFEAAD